MVRDDLSLTGFCRNDLTLQKRTEIRHLHLSVTAVNNFLPKALSIFLLTVFSCLQIFAAAAQMTTSRLAPLLCEITDISTQSRSLHITVTASAPPMEFLSGVIELRFPDEFASVRDLSQRVARLKAISETGQNIAPEFHGSTVRFKPAHPIKKLIVSWETKLARAMEPGNYALVSGLGPESGFLMMHDLLPQFCFVQSADCEMLWQEWIIRVTPPDAWQILSTAGNAREGISDSNISQMIVFMGQVRQQRLKVPGMRLQLAIVGQWQFSDEEIARLTVAIAGEHLAMMGGLNVSSRPSDETTEPFLVTLSPYPIPMTGLRSSALTRHHTVVMMLNQSEDAKRTFAHYARHLAHEMFHYYLPGAFVIRENFDWFWEGFTRYIALLTLQRQRLLNLQTYLDVLTEEYDAYAFNPMKGRVSLIEASPEKFASLAAYDLVYRKGMLVAALYDLELRYQSNGARNLTEVMRNLYQNYARKNLPTGNSEVLTELSRGGNFRDFIRDYIQGTREIDLETIIKPYGLTVDRSTLNKSRPRLVPAQKLSARQQLLLAQLGK
jgi:predicted metalloprotease with PDZ domain